jgi:hypothetical protein
VLIVILGIGDSHFKYRVINRNIKDNKNSRTQKIEPLDYAEIIENTKLTKDNRKIITVVAAAGGGITALVWTANALNEINQSTNGDFYDSLAFISAVSGGSVGVYAYLTHVIEQNYTTIDNQKNNFSRKLKDKLLQASKKSLNKVLWGTAINDIPMIWLFRDKIFFDTKLIYLLLADNGPYDLSDQNRGSFLSTNWSIIFEGLRSFDCVDRTRLGDWVDIVRLTENRFPAVSLNSAILTNSLPFLFSTAKLQNKKQNSQPQVVNSTLEGIILSTFFDEYPGWDVDVAVAARQSATFPIISPISRPNLVHSSGKPYSLMDGGYFDNSGLFVAMYWIKGLCDYITEDNKNRKESINVEIVLIEIENFPDKVEDEEFKPRNIVAQYFGPLQGAIALRKPVSKWLIPNFKRNLLNEIDNHPSIKVHEIPIKPGPESPNTLSWQLTDIEIEKILDEGHWKGDENPNYQKMCELKKIYSSELCDPAQSR